MGGGGGILGGARNFLFGDNGAQAAQDAAMAQQQAAGRNYNTVKNIGEQMTTQGLLEYDKTLAAQDRELSRQEQMVRQIDPTVLEASQQALKLLRGESASSLKPAQEARAQQRAQLLNTLREQLGPGAETSTAGIQALNRFDSETNSLLASQQQQALQGVNQTFSTYSPYGQQINQSIGQRAGIVGNRAGLQFNYANLLNQAAGPVTSSAGAQYTADALRGQANAAFGQQLLGAGVTLGAGYLSRSPVSKLTDAGGRGISGMAGQSYLNAGNIA